MSERRDEARPAPNAAALTPPDERRHDPTAATLARLDAVPTIAGLDRLRDRLQEGTLVAGRYRIQGMLGIGGMGAVYRAHDQLLDLEVALKVLRSEIAGDGSFLQRFRQELIVARRVTHRHVVRIHDLGEHEGMPFMTMDLIRGRSLRELLQAEGTMDVPRSLKLVRQVAEALAEAHRQGVVHRDLKPSNILIDEQGDAFVTDFGVARSLHAPGLTRTGEVLGTPDYLAPEQARGEKVDGRSDLYALGLIWFEMLSGDRPYQGGSLLEVLAQHMSGRTRTLKEVGVAVPAPVDAILRQCLAREVEQRYPDAKALIGDLDDLGRPARRRWLRRVEVVAAVMLLALAGVLLWRQLPALRSDPAGPVESPEQAAPAVRSVAILPFVTDSPALAWSADGLPELLAGALQESAAVRVVSTSRVAQTLRDLGFDAGTLDERGLARLAGLLQVDRLVSGRMEAVGSQVRLLVRVDEVQGGTLVPRQLPPQVGDAAQLFALTERLGDALRQRLELPEEARPRRALSASSVAMRAYSEGSALLSQGDLESAAPALEKAVEADPTFAAGWLQLSRAYQRQGRVEDALRAAERATASTGADSGRVGFEARAQEALLRNRPEEAQRALAALVTRYPNDLVSRVALAEAYGGQGSYREAIAALREVVLRDPKDPRAWYLLGRYTIEAGDAEPAIESLTRALVLQKELGNRRGQAEVTNALGVAYGRLGRVDDAIAEYRQAAQLRAELGDQRGLATTQHNLGILLLQRGDYAGAEREISSSLGIYRELENPAGIAKLENAYGVLEEERGSLEAALARYQQALKLRNELGDEAALAESHNNVGYAYFLLGQYENAQLYLASSLRLYEQHGNTTGALKALQSRGACELAQGQWEAALATFHGSLERSRDLDLQELAAVGHGSLGRLAHLEGRYGAALASFGQARKIVEQLDWLRGKAEIALGDASSMLELGALDEATRRLEQVSVWSGQGLSREHEAQLALLQARLLVARGEGERARQAAAAAQRLAVASHSPPLQLEARLVAAVVAADSRALRASLNDAQRLGHAELELRAGEAVARVELASGRAQPAILVLQAALKRARGAGSWGRAWALHALLARSYDRAGQPQRAAEELALARREADRVEQASPPEQRARFAALPAVRELRLGAG